MTGWLAEFFSHPIKGCSHSKIVIEMQVFDVKAAGGWGGRVLTDEVV